MLESAYFSAFPTASFLSIFCGKTLSFSSGGSVSLPVDGGMFDNPRYCLYHSKYSAILANRANETPTEYVSLAGKCCESGDLIGDHFNLPKAEIGDIVAVLSTGAYNYSMASNYNRNLIPPVILVKDGKAEYLVKPQTYEDLTRNDIVPSYLKKA